MRNFFMLSLGALAASSSNIPALRSSDLSTSNTDLCFGDPEHGMKLTVVASEKETALDAIAKCNTTINPLACPINPELKEICTEEAEDTGAHLLVGALYNSETDPDLLKCIEDEISCHNNSLPGST
ncbi:MAG TPA: hypothetical protein VD770_02715, partial [Coxiellaceae bacterium]|nr:hypothetical protein [Coxiellaceae bacterium]